MIAQDTGAGHGIVEGFYGRPWGLDRRIRVVRELGASGLTTYLWAPKDEASHRKAWRAPLTSVALREIASLADVARESSVDFVYGLSPLGIARPTRRLGAEHALDPAAMSALRERVDAVASAGVERFALLFDDTWPTLFPGAASASLGRCHGDAALAIKERFADGGRARVVIVPAVYHRRASELAPGGIAYLRGIASRVGRDVPVAWTGPHVFSTWIAGNDIEAFERTTGLRVFIWNNAIANDWLPLVTSALGARRATERLSTGPLTNLGADALSSAAGVLLNGAREAELTRIATASLGDLVRTPRSFDPFASWSSAIERVFGDASPLVRELLDQVRGHPLCGPYARDWTLSDLARAARAGDSRASYSLALRASGLVELEGRLTEALAGHPALSELRPTASAIGDAAKRLRAVALGERAGAKSSAPATWATDLDVILALFRGRPIG